MIGKIWQKALVATVLTSALTCSFVAEAAMIIVTKEGGSSSTTTTTIKTPTKTTESTTTVVTKPNKDKKTATTTKTTTVTTTKTSTTTDSTKGQGETKHTVKVSKVPAFSEGVEASVPPVRVLLGSRTTSWVAAGSGKMAVYTLNKTALPKATTGDAVVVAVKNNKITVNGKAVEGGIYIKSWQGNTPGTMLVDSKPYRGAIKVVPTSSGAMMLINEVGLEDYLYGVVPAEVVPSWPQEALKAQAVAARTYALYNMKQSVNKAYDVQPNTNHQVYNGQAAEFASTTKAVDDTKGMVMKYKGQLIEALFHADGGGYTENSENVWGSVVPYLRGVKDYAQNGDSSAWTVKLTRSAMEAKLKAAGKDVGTLKEIKLSTLRKRPIKQADRGVSGRVLTATFVGSKKSLTLSGDTIMKIFGLKSTLFDFYVNVKTPTSADSFKNPKAYHTFKKATDTVSIRGYGWGHGLGMSQWGAAAMAAKDGGKGKDYYKQILTHYYTGVSVEKEY
ncbi:SpoIID/LytB domain-containing protein [Veillonella intestinalis]|uniref:SpoIID/LytB domain-containing protein n=1 Tax=Veillonella intestinalis TaxID=2941341 RepID=UPI00203BDCB7|nr:SpoIID/LytB domain-containing protein [Veillonella intestinalis]